MGSKKYVIVFDLDETIGHFSQIYRFWNLIKGYLHDEKLDKVHLFNLFDTFPHYFRVNIFKLFKLIKNKKENNLCNKVMIFTNNNGPLNWVSLIKEYIHKKLNYNLFDQIIRAFKVNGEKIELCRTSHEKSHKDFINCTKLPENTEICFIDDVYHKKMEHENVLYINLKPYYYIAEYEDLAYKFYNTNKKLFKNDYLHFKKFILENTHYDSYNCYIQKTTVEKNLEFLITEKLIKEISLFFNNKKIITRKNKNKRKHNTRKKLK